MCYHCLWELDKAWHSEAERTQHARAACSVIQQRQHRWAEGELSSFSFSCSFLLSSKSPDSGVAVLWNDKVSLKRAAVLWRGEHNVPAACWSHSHGSGKGRLDVWKDQNGFLLKWKPEGGGSWMIFTASAHTALGWREGVVILKMGRTASAIWVLVCWWRSRWSPEQKHPVSFTSKPALKIL